MLRISIIPDAIFRLYKMLPPKYKRKLLFCILGVFLMAFADLLGLGVLLPILLLVIKDNSIVDNVYMNKLYVLSGADNPATFIFVICAVILLISLLRVLFTMGLQYMQNKRLFEILNYIALRLYRLYHGKGFLYIKHHSSLHLINNINNGTLSLIQGYFIPFTALACEIIVITVIFIGIVFFSPYVFVLVLLTFIPISVLYYRFSKERMRRYGRLLYELKPLKDRLLQQTFIGYSDMEMNNSFPACESKYRQLLKKQNDLSVKNLLLQTSLQRVLELAIICSVVALIMATQLLTLPSLGIVIGMFALAVYRVLPGIVKGSGYLNSMRNNTFALNVLSEFEDMEEYEKSFQETNQIKQIPLPFCRNIKMDALNFSYEEGKRVIRNFSLEINKGDFIGIRGNSGSGKSTLFHLLLGFLKPDSGAIYVDDVPLSAQVMVDWRSKIGYVSQQLFMMEGSLLDNIAMDALGRNTDRERAYEALRLASLDKFVMGLSKGIDTPVGEGGCLLSGGQRQRLGIARALYKEADILLFDEATSSLDPTTEQAINEAIVYLREMRSELTLLVISHRPESLSICQRIIDISME